MRFLKCTEQGNVQIVQRQESYCVRLYQS